VDVHQVKTSDYRTEKLEGDRVVETETSNVDLAEEFGERIVTQNAYSVNLKTIKAQEEMLGSLLDIFE
jgi:flagellar hook protein FlgE